MKKILKNQRGITLIALAVTITIMLILISISINLILENNGIIKRGQDARDKTVEAAREEQAQFKDITEYIEEQGKSLFDTIDQVNKPKLTTGMIPVKYDVTEKKWRICSTTDVEWYNYRTKKEWANVMLSDGKYYSADANLTEEEKTSKKLAQKDTLVDEADLGSMFVWIPSFAYKITSQYHDITTEEKPGGIEVKFLVGRSNKTVDNAKIELYNKNTTNNYTQFPDGYVIHPAFKNGYGDYSNGEWKADILGIWVAKFQAGIYTTSDDTATKITSNNSEDTSINNYYFPVFKGRKFGYNRMTESQCYNISLALSSDGNPYGIKSSSNSHLMKNSEWGAAAYLSMSQYGYSEGVIKPSNEKARNNFDISGSVAYPNITKYKIYGITGYSSKTGKSERNALTYSATFNTDKHTFNDEVGSGETVSYAWNVTDDNSSIGKGTKSSTTGNIYGIYDMSSGLAEYTASYVNNIAYSESGAAFATGESTYLATAYPNRATTYTDFNSAYDAGEFQKVYGDAIWETSKSAGEGLTWYGDTIEDDSDGEQLFFCRGGSWKWNFYGLCGLYDVYGGANASNGFRTVLISE